METAQTDLYDLRAGGSPVELIFPLVIFFSMFALFYKYDMDSSVIDDEMAPEDLSKRPSTDDKTVSDKYVPGGPLEGVSPSVWYNSGGVYEGGDNKAVKYLDGSFLYTGGSLNMQVVWDWFNGVGVSEDAPETETPKNILHDRKKLMQMDYDDSIQVLKDNHILTHPDLWKTITTKCSDINLKQSAEECLKDRQGLKIIAYKHFASDEPPFTTTVRPFRLQLMDAQEVSLIGTGTENKNCSDLNKVCVSQTKYYLGSVDLIDGYNPALLGYKI